MALPAPLFSSVYGEPACWSGPYPDCDAAMTLLGPTATTDKDEVAQTYLDMAQRYPVTTNPHADTALLKRYRDSPFSSLTELQKAAGEGASVPKHRGEPACLTWALRGVCNSNCKRKESHVRCSRDAVKGLHDCLDACGVAQA